MPIRLKVFSDGKTVLKVGGEALVQWRDLTQSDAPVQDPAVCPFCLAKAVLKLTPKLTSAQPDDTTHVCHPALGGCNQGFAQ